MAASRGYGNSSLSLSDSQRSASGLSTRLRYSSLSEPQSKLKTTAIVDRECRSPRRIPRLIPRENTKQALCRLRSNGVREAQTDRLPNPVCSVCTVLWDSASRRVLKRSRMCTHPLHSTANRMRANATTNNSDAGTILRATTSRAECRRSMGSRESEFWLLRSRR